MSARTDILKRIKKEEDRLKKIRAASHEKPETLVLRCIELIEKARVESVNGHEFATVVYQETETLCRRLQSLAGGQVILSVRWNQEADLENRENDEGSWKDLRIMGVTVEWPEAYAKKRKAKEESISIDQLFLEGLLN